MSDNRWSVRNRSVLAVPMTVASMLSRSRQMLPRTLALYAAASLLHFTHNAEYLAQYPNLPGSWTRADVYLAWCCITAVGLLGYLIYRGGSHRIGIVVLAIYGGFGFDGLLHYTRAPFARHSAAMNFTIWVEVAFATAFLINLVSVTSSHIRLNAKSGA